ncbi:MAG TPA: hypothetical protein VI864_08125 [Candidatus Bathyarchaeia archaeon]|nr:hypothetical protein [Candidatus Bathyarchaeia archaeon]
MPNLNNISAEITGVKYTPYLCRKLRTFELKDLVQALSEESTFILRINQQQIAVSWWVSAKRTRTYPYARVYDSLAFSGKKVTLIPIVKDEGADGERDFLQYDTVSLMSLLGVYVIIGYYADAEVNSKYPNKITRQRYDIQQITGEIQKLLSYQSDALHWNLAQLEKAGEIGEKAIEAYSRISTALGVNMHSIELARKRIKELEKGKETFLKLSRNLAEKAQRRESITKQPKERLDGEKATITIKNYLGGEYFLTSDEVEIHENEIFLIEGKHTKDKRLPALSDIKDGLLRMILLTNIQDVRIGNKQFTSVPILKLTTGHPAKLDSLNREERKTLGLLEKESEKNGFRILINTHFPKRKE